MVGGIHTHSNCNIDRSYIADDLLRPLGGIDSTSIETDHRIVSAKQPRPTLTYSGAEADCESPMYLFDNASSAKDGLPCRPFDALDPNNLTSERDVDRPSYERKKPVTQMIVGGMVQYLVKVQGILSGR